MDVERRMEIIRELCSFERRRTGTDAERRASLRVAERLREIGRPVEIEPTTVHPQYGYVHALHCLLGVAGSLIAIEAPALGFALVLLAATSMYLDLEYRLYLARSLFFRRASQNLVSRRNTLSRGDGPAAAQLIICAHLDAARTGAVFSPGLARRWAKIQRRLPWLGPFRILFWSLALLLPLLGARMAGIDSVALSALALPPTLVLLVGAFALVEIELSEVVPGANDNASGVATALSIAEELESEPPRNLKVSFVFNGGEEPIQEGMRAFLRARRGELEPETTCFLALDTLGDGQVRFGIAGGWVTTYRADRRLVELCEAIAAADSEGDDRFQAEPLRRGVGGASTPACIAGLRSIGLTCMPASGYRTHVQVRSDIAANVDPDALERAHAFALELIHRLDRDVERAARGAARGPVMETPA